MDTYSVYEYLGVVISFSVDIYCHFLVRQSSVFILIQFGYFIDESFVSLLLVLSKGSSEYYSI